MTLFSLPLRCLRDRLGEYQPGAWISRTDTPQQFNLCPLSLGSCAVCPCTVNETDRQNISLLLGSLGQTPSYSLTCVLCFCDLNRTVCPCPVYQTDRQDVSLVPGSSNSLTSLCPFIVSVTLCSFSLSCLRDRTAESALVTPATV